VAQIWTYDHALCGGSPARAFVWMRGHNDSNFNKPEIQGTRQRAVAGAGRHPVDELVDYKSPLRPSRPQ